jgi:hypothetical protein
MDDFIDVSSDSDEDENNSQILNFSITDNNNGSFTDHKVLSTQQVYTLMEHEMKSVQDVVTDVSNTRIHCSAINQKLFIFSAFCQQNAIAAERVQMGQRETARVDSRGWQPSCSAYEECLGVCRM